MIHFRWCRLSCTWYILYIFSSTLPTTFHSLKCRLLTCIFSRCCLQYASVLQAGSIFQAINWFLFVYISEQKGHLLVVSVIKHKITTPRIRSFCTLYARQTIINCMLRHYSPTVYYLLQCWSSIRKGTGFAGNVQSTMK